MYSVLDKLSEYVYFYTTKNIISYSFLLVFKIVESLRCILKDIQRFLMVYSFFDSSASISLKLPASF